MKCAMPDFAKSLPPGMSSRLRRMIRRVRAVQLLRGLCVTFATALAALLAVMAADFAVPFMPDAIRLAASLAALAATAAAFWFSTVRPLADPISPVRMARILETRHPELQERISSAIELVATDGDGGGSASRELLALLVSDAVQDVSSFDAGREFRGSTLRPCAIAACVAATVLLVAFAVSPRRTARLFIRAVAPRAPVGNVASIGFRVAPGDITVIAGSTVEFSLTVPRQIGDRADLVTRRRGEPETVERMTRVFNPDISAPPSFVLRLPAVRDSFTYRMRLGKALTRPYAVKVLPPLNVDSLSLDMEYPEYLGMPPLHMETNSLPDISAPFGSRASVTAVFNREASASVHIGNRIVRPASPAPALSAGFDWTISTNSASSWAISMRDSLGFTNSTRSAAYQVVPDFAPDIRLTFPSGSRYVLPTFGHLKTVYEIRDDHSLTSCSIFIVPDDDPNPWISECEAQRTANGLWTVTHDISLGVFLLQGRRKVRIWLEAEDDLPASLGGPNRSRSRVIAVELDNGERRSLSEQVREPERAAIEANLEASVKLVEEASRKLEESLSANTATDADRLVEEAQALASDAAEKAAEAVGTARDGLFAKVAEPISAEVSEKLDEVAEDAAALPLTEEQLREKAVRESIEKMNRIMEETKAILPEIERIDKALARADALESLAVEEEAQAAEARRRQMTGPELDAWQARQEELAGRFDSLDSGAKPASPEAPEGARASDDAATAGETVRRASEKARVSIAAAKEAPRDDGRIQAARSLEEAAKELLSAAQGTEKAEKLHAAAAKDGEAAAAIAERAESVAERAEAIADDALRVNMGDFAEAVEKPEPEIAQALELAEKAKKIAALAGQPPMAGQETGSGKMEALADEVAAEAAEVAQSANPLLKAAAEAAKQAAMAAEEGFAAEAATAAEEAGRNAGLAAKTPREQAEAASVAAGEALEKASDLLERLEKTLQPDGQEGASSGQASSAATGNDAELADIAVKAAEVAQAAERAAADANGASANAKEKGQSNAARAAQAAHDAAKEVAEAAGAVRDAAAKARQNLTDGRAAAEGDLAKARGKAESAGRRLENQARDAVAKPAAAHAIDAAEAAAAIADTAEELSKAIVPPPPKPLQSGRTPSEVKEALGRAMADARKAADAAEAMARDAGEALPAKAAQAAREAVKQGESVLRAFSAFENPQGNPPPNPVQLANQAKAAVDKAKGSAELAASLAEASGLAPDQHAEAAEARLAEYRDALAGIAGSIADEAEAVAAGGEGTQDAARRLDELEKAAREIQREAREMPGEILRLRDNARDAARREKAAADVRNLDFSGPVPAEIAEKRLEDIQRRVQNLPSLAGDLARLALQAKDKPDMAGKQAGQVLNGPDFENAGLEKRGGLPPTAAGNAAQSGETGQSGADILPLPESPSREAQNLLHELDEAENLAGDAAEALSAGDASSAGAAAKESADAAHAVARKARSLGEGREAQAGDLLSKAVMAAGQAEKKATEALGSMPKGDPAYSDLTQVASGIIDAAGQGFDANEAADTARGAIGALGKAQAPSKEQGEAAQKAHEAAQGLRQLAALAAQEAGLDSGSMRAPGKDGGPGGGGRTDAKARKKPEPSDGGGADASGDAADSPNEEEDSESAGEADDPDVVEMPEWLRRLGFPLSEWLKFKGTAESGLPDGSLDRVPPEYRELVRQYFNLLSTEK